MTKLRLLAALTFLTLVLAPLPESARLQPGGFAYAQDANENENANPIESDLNSDNTNQGDTAADEPIEDTVEGEVTETPPPPEYPYPGTTEEGFKPRAAGEMKIPSQQPSGPATSIAPPPPAERPLTITEQGEYYYDVEHSPKKASASVRLGFFQPPDFKNQENEATFKSIYGEGNVPVVFFDYEWQLTQKVGGLGIKIASGLFIRSGKGKFVIPRPAGAENEEPDEQFTFIMLPNTATAIYRFQYHDRQPFVPFIEGGAGYFTFTETRDDDKSPKYGASPVTVAAAGANFLLDWLDRHAIRQLDRDYGINHVWLTAEYRAIIGSGKYDFSSQVVNAGFLMEF